MHYDDGLNAAAQKHFVTALRASATAGDAPAGTSILSCMAHQTCSVGNPQDAVMLMQTAQEQGRNRATPRSADHPACAYRSCAVPHPYGRYAAARELEKARDAWAKGVHDDDPSWAYWITAGEIGLAAGSAALALNDPRRALGFFDAARSTDYSTDAHARDHAVYPVRMAEAHLAAGEIDEACGAARQAF